MRTSTMAAPHFWQGSVVVVFVTLPIAKPCAFSRAASREIAPGPGFGSLHPCYLFDVASDGSHVPATLKARK
jgi:hypothetical protein